MGVFFIVVERDRGPPKTEFKNVFKTVNAKNPLLMIWQGN